MTTAVRERGTTTKVTAAGRTASKRRTTHKEPHTATSAGGELPVPSVTVATPVPTPAIASSKGEATDAFVEPASAALNQWAPENGLASLREMLLQGLISRDNDLLERSLSVQEPALIKGALLALPDAQVVPLLGELISRLQRKPRRTLLLLPWLRQVLLLKSTLLMTSEGECVEEQVLRPLLGLIEARTRAHKRMVQLKGRLDFILAQADEAQRQQPLISTDQINRLMTTPMATFDESSEEDEDEDEYEQQGEGQEYPDGISDEATDEEDDEHGMDIDEDEEDASALDDDHSDSDDE